MFYSHEILTSRQYGVATIWLVATIGKGSNTRRLSRKAIQEVDVQKACGKIIEPGAPIALRLQGNLLFGASRVYNRQCAYVLTDAKKVKAAMELFIKSFSGNQIDPEAGQARPENLVIRNDPDFIPEIQLPRFDLDSIVKSYSSQKTSSQMSPADTNQLPGSHSTGHGFPLQLDLGRSDSSSGPGGSAFGLQGLSSARKHDDEPLFFAQDDGFVAGDDCGFEVDEEGNIVESAAPAVVGDEPELPPMPGPSGGEQPHKEVPGDEQDAIIDDQGDIIMMGEDPLPAAEPFPERQDHQAFQDDEPAARPAPVRRKRKAHVLKADEETQLSRHILRAWQDDYLDNCASKPKQHVRPTQAKRNAMLLTFGLGIGSVGQNIGIPGMMHPLAVEFSGDVLFTAITGLEIPEQPRGRRRSASEAIEDEQEQRRVRPRLEAEEGEPQLGRDQPMDDVVNSDPFVDETVEVGREPEQPMSDQHHSSAMPLPWNRGSSAVPGSSIRGSAQKGRDLSSPTRGRGDVPDIVRYSDDGPAGFGGSDGFDFGPPPQRDDSSFDGMGAPGEVAAAVAEPEVDVQKQNESLREALDRDGKNFLRFVEGIVDENGERRLDDDFERNRKWVAFDDLFVPRETPRETAAQAFYHALSLATQGRMSVEQEDAGNLGGFGPIWLGTTVSPAA